MRGGPWTHKGDAVLFAEFDGKGKAADVKLDAMRIWVQIRDLPYPLMKVDMGWLLGANLGKVLAVSNRDGVIVDEHLRVWVEHPVDKPMMRWVKVQLEGSAEEIRYFVKYEKLPFFCLCCGIIGHTSERFWSLFVSRPIRPASELRATSKRKDMAAPRRQVWGGQVASSSPKMYQPSKVMWRMMPWRTVPLRRPWR